MPVISVPRTLRQQLGDDGADDLVNLINRATEDAKEDTLVLAEERYERRLSEETSGVNQNIAETRAALKQEIAETAAALKQEIAETRAELRQEIAETRAELRQEIVETRGELQTQLAETKSDLIRWMFIFWVGQLAAMLGILFVLLR